MSEHHATTSLPSLPTEILLEIASYLDLASIASLVLTTKQTRQQLGTDAFTQIAARYCNINWRDRPQYGGTLCVGTFGTAVTSEHLPFEPLSAVSARWAFLMGLARDSNDRLYFCDDCETLHDSEERRQILAQCREKDDMHLDIGCSSIFEYLSLRPETFVVARKREHCASKFLDLKPALSLVPAPTGVVQVVGGLRRQRHDLTFHQTIHGHVSVGTSTSIPTSLRIKFRYSVRSESPDSGPSSGLRADQKRFLFRDALITHILDAGFTICKHLSWSSQRQAPYYRRPHDGGPLPDVNNYVWDRLMFPSTGMESLEPCPICGTKFTCHKDGTGFELVVDSSFETAAYNSQRYFRGVGPESMDSTFASNGGKSIAKPPSYDEFWRSGHREPTLWERLWSPLFSGREYLNFDGRDTGRWCDRHGRAHRTEKQYAACMRQKLGKVYY